ncbi:MAG: (2Fe-2S)-binding protein [Chloroflexota bacterium]|nr:(2Fe-2S)-binding protein [Chloroflexota bacterium]
MAATDPTTRKVPVTLNINGEQYDVLVQARRTLLDTLRENLGLTGTKKVCDMGNCGACTVIVDGRTHYSCLLLTVECEGKEIRTIEGVARDGQLHPVQQAFIEEDALQCGFCTPGQVLSVVSLLERNPEPSADEVRLAVSGNLCRCGAYQKIFRAAESAARSMRS